MDKSQALEGCISKCLSFSFNISSFLFSPAAKEDMQICKFVYSAAGRDREFVLSFRSPSADRCFFPSFSSFLMTPLRDDFPCHHLWDDPRNGQPNVHGRARATMSSRWAFDVSVENCLLGIAFTSPFIRLLGCGDGTYGTVRPDRLDRRQLPLSSVIWFLGSGF